jgi:hypothetical protein
MAVAVSEQNAELSLTDVGGIRQYGLENRFKLAWRTADYFEYLDGCGLLLSRLRELTLEWASSLVSSWILRSAEARSSVGKAVMTTRASLATRPFGFGLIVGAG